MSSSADTRRSAQLLTYIAVATLTIVARLPFLLRADRFFNSDEAVEGLMARHVLQGEYPLFLWGQRYKGVPEVYLSSAVFHWIPTADASVIALKAVTLVCFATFVCLNFAMLERTCSRAVAWIATALLVAGPPSLVFGSLSGSAEIVMTFIAGSVMCLGVDAWRRTGSQWGLVAASAAVGFGLWVQHYILYYVAALALTLIIHTPEMRERVQTIVASRPLRMRWMRWVPVLLLAFLGGYSPAIVGLASSHGPLAPAPILDLAELRASLSPIAREVVPIVFGFRSPSTAPLGVPSWSALVLVIVLVVSFVAIRRRPYTLFFHRFVLTSPILFLASGSFIDAQSYRYLMPMHAALPVVYAVGIEHVLRANRAAGVVLLTSLLAVFILGQVNWYRQLEPDRESVAIVDCLDRAGIRAAFADYWLSYKLMFLVGERITLAPVNGVDRYPPYTATVRAQRSAVTIARPQVSASDPIECRAMIQEGEPRIGIVSPH